MIANTYHTLKSVLHDAGYDTGLGDEGGVLLTTEDTIKMLYKAIGEADYKPTRSRYCDRN